MQIKIVKFLFINLVVVIHLNSFALNENGLDAFSPSLSKMSININYKEQKNSSKTVEPSPFYSPNFYNIDEFKPIFESFQYVRKAIENPVVVKNQELIHNVEMTFTPHFILLDTATAAAKELKFSIELKAIFL